MKRFFATLAAGAVLATSFVAVETTVTAPPAEAVYATGGDGAYSGQIDWLVWGEDGAEVTDGDTATTTRQIGGQELQTTCEITGIDGTLGGLEAYRSGTWRNDGLVHLYNIGGVDDNQLVNGLSNDEDTDEVGFSVDCQTTLDDTEVEMAGLVIADAEASNAGQGEYVQATPHQDAQWHLIERYRMPTCTEDVNAVVEENDDNSLGNTLRFEPAGGECEGEGPN